MPLDRDERDTLKADIEAEAVKMSLEEDEDVLQVIMLIDDGEDETHILKHLEPQLVVGLKMDLAAEVLVLIDAGGVSSMPVNKPATVYTPPSKSAEEIALETENQRVASLEDSADIKLVEYEDSLSDAEKKSTLRYTDDEVVMSKERTR